VETRKTLGATWFSAAASAARSLRLVTLVAGSLLLLISFTTNYGDDNVFQFGRLLERLVALTEALLHFSDSADLLAWFTTHVGWSSSAVMAAGRIFYFAWLDSPSCRVS